MQFSRLSWYSAQYNAVTLPTSKVIPINIPLSNIIFRKCMCRTIWTNVQWNVLNYSFPTKFRTNICNNMLAYFTNFLEATTLKTMLTSVVNVGN